VSLWALIELTLVALVILAGITVWLALVDGCIWTR